MKATSTHLRGGLGLLTLLTGLGAAQGVLPLSGDYVYANLEAQFHDCAGPGTLSASAGIGMVKFAPDGTLSGFSTRRDVCADGTVGDVFELLNGTHVHDALGTLFLDLDPSAPGTETSTLFLRFDHELLVIGHVLDGFANTGLAVPRAVGASAATLSGQYSYVREEFDQQPGGLVAACELGTLVLDGAGGYTLSGTRHEVTPTQTFDSAVGDTGTYAVTPDGLLTFGSSANQGGLTADGRLAFWIERVGTQVGMTVAFRREGTFAPSEVFGPWRLESLSAQPGLGLDEPQMSTAVAAIDVDGAAGTYALTGQVIETTPTGSTLQSTAETGLLTILADGTLSAQAAGSTKSIPGALDSTRSLMAFASLNDPGYVEIDLLTRRLVPAAPYGGATPGTGAVAPALTASGGLSFLGNPAFALAASQVRGQATVALGLSHGPALGVPALGGALWIDPTKLFYTGVSVASGTAGAPGAGTASFAAPIPPNPLLAGYDVYAQAIVLDPGAPAGLAMTPGLAFQLW